MKLWQWLLRLVSGRPHFAIGGWENPYLLRWYLIPRNRWFNVYLHKFLRDDDDRALHCHPWWSASLTLSTGYHEVTENGKRWIGRGRLVIRSGTFRHRVIVSEAGRPAWTLFLTGPRYRTWGFYCPRGFVPWYDFVDRSDSGQVGKGCGEQ